MPKLTRSDTRARAESTMRAGTSKGRKRLARHRSGPPGGAKTIRYSALTGSAHGVPRSSLVTAMARNGTDFGIRASGLGERWFTAPAGTPLRLDSGFGAEHANRDIGAGLVKPPRACFDAALHALAAEPRDG